MSPSCLSLSLSPPWPLRVDRDLEFSLSSLHFPRAISMDLMKKAHRWSVGEEEEEEEEEGAAARLGVREVGVVVVVAPPLE